MQGCLQKPATPTTMASTTRVHISEHGANYDETISLDANYHTVTYHVPAHLNLTEHITIVNNATREELTFLPERSLCHLTSLPHDAANPEAAFQFFSGVEDVLTPNASKLVKYVNIPLGLVSSTEMAGE